MISKNTATIAVRCSFRRARFAGSAAKFSRILQFVERHRGDDRVLDAPPPTLGHTQYANSGRPARLTCTRRIVVRSVGNHESAKERSHRKFLLVGFALIVLFVSVISSVIIAGLWNRPDFRRGRRPSRPVVSVPDETRRPPSLPDTGPPPLVPPPGGAPATSSNQLIYPGAETVLSVDSGRVLQLRTGDSFEKVFAWYSSKLQPAQIIRPPGNETAIIKAEKVAAVITAVDGHLTIMLKQDAL